MRMKNLFCRMIILIAFVFGSCKKEEIKTETRTYNFTISSSSSTLSNASVSIQTKSQNYTATTDNDGKCLINIPNSVSLPTYTIVTIDHSSIKPNCLTVSGEANANYSIPINCANLPTIVRLKEISLHHLGNDQYSGSANSQLQLPTEGLEKTFSYNLPATPGVMPRIQIYARGVQHSAQILSNGTLVGSLNDSNSSGDLSLYDFQAKGTANTIYRAGTNYITIKTGATGNSSDPWDDIEFCGILIYYQ
jgi:hypothetical protein